MTGFGRAEFKTPTGAVQIEIKTTNHRYYEFSSRLPYPLLTHEEEIRKVTQARVKREKVYLSVAAPELLVRRGRLYVDEPLAKEYLKAYQKLNRVLKLKEKISLSQIARMPDVITSSTSTSERDLFWRHIRGALSKALNALDLSRRTEGRTLQQDLLKRSKKMQKALIQIRKRAPKIVALYKKRALKRYKKESNGGPSALERINQDVASFSKNTDITEETVRLGSHLHTFQKTLRRGGELGRKIDFIAQEMMREVNTTGAKCNDIEIAGQVIEIKSELEKIREQAQNLE